ncbi:MAG: glycosyltransferase [Gallionella sp.]|nr:glycosyltransferase [Gallionella sp.]MDD4957829.1 glycosyltransferase [Gallionella sp.]
MKIGIQTWGSTGDIMPFIALADGLIQAGHQVTLVVSSIDNRSYQETCESLGIPYRQIPAHIDFDVREFSQRTLRMNTRQWLIVLLEATFFPYEQEIYQAAIQLVAEHDLVIGHNFLYPLKLAAKKHHKPHISVMYWPVTITTNTSPPSRLPNLGRTLNRWQWELLHQVFDWILKKRISPLWIAEGMPAFKHVYDSLLSSDLLNLVTVDPLLCSVSHEWRAVHQLCGFLNLPERAEHWHASPTLQTFLAQGEKPIYMTLGSLQQTVPEWSMELFIHAARLAGCRAIIQTSSPHYPADTQQDNVFFIGRHPYSPLFQHCAAVVHHGGSGTSHVVTQSGCPSIVIHSMDEQLFWSLQLQHAGLAPAPLAIKRATAEKLAERIKTVMASSDMTKRAQQAKQSMSNTQGILNAVRLIEEASEAWKRSN